jgi:hypothetical protein
MEHRDGSSTPSITSAVRSDEDLEGAGRREFRHTPLGLRSLAGVA